MKHLVWFVAVLGALGGRAAEAGADSNALAKFGLLGSWAVDCRAPPSASNPYQTFVPSTDGQPSRQLIVGNPDLDRLVPVHDVKELGSDRISLSFPQNNITVTVVLVKDKGRVRPLESSTSDGQSVVADGMVERTGQLTAWFQKCPD